MRTDQILTIALKHQATSLNQNNPRGLIDFMDETIDNPGSVTAAQSERR